MPQVSKQRTNEKSTPKKTGGIRDRIQSLRELSQSYGIRMMLFGGTKTGKTTLACSFPKKLMLIGTMGTLEDGTMSVSDISEREGTFFPLYQSTELDEICDVVVEDGYKTVVLDTGGGLQDLILKEHLGLDQAPIQKFWGLADQKDWQVIGAQTKERLRKLLSLSMDHGINVVIIAHERDFRKEDEKKSLDLCSPFIGAALTPTVAGWLNGVCDYIGHTFVRERMVEKTVKIGKGEQKVLQGTGKTEFCLRIGMSQVYMTGFRKTKKREIPDLIVDPSYDKLRELIDG